MNLLLQERQQAQAAKLKDVNAAIASKTSDHANLLGEQAKLDRVLSAQQVILELHNTMTLTLRRTSPDHFMLAAC